MFDLRKFRKDKKLTQNDIAFIFNCSQANVASIEKEQKDLTELQMQILTEKYGDISEYNILFSLDDDTTKEKRNYNHWEDLINKYHESNKELIELLKKEKEEKEKLLDTINILTQALIDRKAV